jgi:peptidoglycan/xylan/chitin deacetylase (PgdA/CDA1 family)
MKIALLALAYNLIVKKSPESRIGKNDTFILLYHKISDFAFDPHRNIVGIKNFKEQIKLVSSLKQIIPLQELLDGIKQKRIPKNSVVLTFDDDYGDIITTALPILKEYNAPATFFIISGKLDNKKEFWWDALERIFLQPNVLPEELILQIGKTKRRWHLGKDKKYSQKDFNNNLKWHIQTVKVSYPTKRHRIFAALMRIFKETDYKTRDSLADQLTEWAGIAETARESHKIMTTDELKELSADRLFSFGSHCVRHSSLVHLPLPAQIEEIKGSKKELERILNTPVNYFSYPHGYYSKTIIKLVKEAGFLSACSVVADRITPQTKIFELPRITVPNIPAEAFQRQFLGL